MRLSYAVRLSMMKESWLAPALVLGLVFLDQLGLGCSGPCWLTYRGPHETPRIITPTVAPEHFCDHEVIVKALRCVFVECGFIVMAYPSFVA